MLFIFDMGGVVTSTFELDKVLEKLCISKDDFYNICTLEINIWEQFQKGKIDANDFWQFFSQRVGRLQHLILDGTFSLIEENKFSSEQNIMKIQTYEYDLFRLYFHPELNKETVQIINKLKEKHRVICGTNTIQSHWENHLERGDYSYFDQTYASNKIGFVKPDKSFFEVILQAEGYDAKDTFFTDDKIENCKAAESVGINAVHFTSAKDLAEQWKQYF